MSFIPQDAQWYVADILEEIRVEGDPRNVVHRNTVLIKADSPEDAYAKSIMLGKEGELEYSNPGGRQVRIVFRGLADLNVIHGELKHGAELFYTEKIGVPEEEIKRLIQTKDGLAVFRETKKSTGPDYSPKEIMDQLDQALYPNRKR